MLEAFQDVLRICHETPDDLTALARVSAYLRDQLRAHERRHLRRALRRRLRPRRLTDRHVDGRRGPDANAGNVQPLHEQAPAQGERDAVHEVARRRTRGRERRRAAG